MLIDPVREVPVPIRGRDVAPVKVRGMFAGPLEIPGPEAAANVRGMFADVPENRGTEVAPADMRGAEIPPPDMRGADAPTEPREPAMVTEAARQVATNPKRSIFAFIRVGFVKLDTRKPRELRNFALPEWGIIGVDSRLHEVF